ncbi:MAG: LbetaH domain-containing protein [Saccharofermentanales bacterium]
MNNENISTLIGMESLLDTSHTLAGGLLQKYEFPWEALSDIGSIILQIGEGLSADEYDRTGECIWISKTAKVASSASITGPAIICHGAEVRHCAYIRGNALVGEHAVVGNSTELKNVILFDNVQVPHYNYVGDSILGFKAHMGAGSITSNVKSDKSKVSVKISGTVLETELKKFGAILGDFVEVGCNSVMNPGTIIGRNANVYPLTMVRGYVPENSILKSTNEAVKKV